MADVSVKELEKEIAKILKNADLARTSTNKVIQKLEEVFGVELAEKRKLIDQMVLEYVNAQSSEEDDDDNSDSEYEKEKSKKKKSPKAKKTIAKRGKGGGKGKGGGYTRAYKLSPALSALMGADEMPRHEVVKRVWAIIKEKKLYDPSNRQFAICDDALYKVIGTKRFRTFGMMKYLKTHFIDE